MAGSIWSPGVANFNPQNAGGGGISLGVPKSSPSLAINTAPAGGIKVGAVNPMNYSDPAASGSGSPAPTSPTPVTSGTTTPATTTLSQNFIDAIMQSIANSVANNQRDYADAKTSNASDDTTSENRYNYQVHSNDSNRELAVHNAETAGAKGYQGLRSVLASLGAWGGTGSELAGRAVANTANEDIGGADKTYQENADAVGMAHEAYRKAAGDRDIALDKALYNDNQDAQYKGIQNIMNEAQNVGDTSTYEKFLPQLVAATAPSTPIAGNTLTYNPANVSAFAPPSNLQVSTKPTTTSATTPVNSALYVSKKAQG